MTNSIAEILDTDVMFLCGTNTTEAHPVIGARMKQAQKRGSKLIVVDPRRTKMAESADLFLQIRPGTNIALINAMMNVIYSEGLHDEEYIENRTVQFSKIVQVIKQYTPERAGEICGVDPEDIKKAARMYAKGNKAGIYYTLGVTEYSTGTSGVMSLSNLAMMCGNIGKESAGVNPLRGQNNVQGACDMGGLPTDYPGYQKVFKKEVKEKFENAWGAELSDEVGITITEMMQGVLDDEIRFFYIVGEDPMLTDPDSNHIEEALSKVDFLVVQDIFLTETAKLADVVLPASSFAEKDGTFTNTERRVQRVRKAIEPIGNTKADWMIIMDLMNRMGYEKTYNHPSEIMDEIASLTPSYAGINYDRIEERGIQWPCTDYNHPGTKFLHKDTMAIGKGIFRDIEYTQSPNEATEDYPYILTNGRQVYHYDVRSMTGRTEGLNYLAPSAFVEMSNNTAEKEGISNGDTVRLSNNRGEVITTAKITNKVKDGILYMPFHYDKEEGVNQLTSAKNVDSISKTPELKLAHVKLEKIS